MIFAFSASTLVKLSYEVHFEACKSKTSKFFQSTSNQMENEVDDAN